MLTVDFHKSVGTSGGRGNLAGVRFPDLRSAGRELALRLMEYRGRPDTVVLALVLGGVPVADEVASCLALPLDLMIIRRLLAPRGPGSQTCAVNVAGTLVIDDDLPPPPIIPSRPIDFFVRDALDELAARERLCRAGRAAMDLTDKSVILVDCGMRTGSTMQAAIGALRTLRPARVIAAVPIAAPESREVVAAGVDDLVCLAWPEPFGHTGLWYKDFRRPGDDALGALLVART